jgi:hypothetical protein
VRETGRRKPKFGEGIYVGTARSNWCHISACRPDRSDRNVVEGNDIAGTTAESVDVKEGTSDGVVRGNRFDGSSMTEAATPSPTPAGDSPMWSAAADARGSRRLSAAGCRPHAWRSPPWP